MTIWDEYPSTYRKTEVAAICAALRAGECVSLVGLSGAGKSNLVGFLCARVGEVGLPAFHLVDCNRLSGNDPAALFRLLAEVIGEGEPERGVGLREVEKLVERRLEERPGGLCVALDRFDALNQAGSAGVAGSLRALRDRFKYQLTFLTATRHPLAPDSELSELFYGHTLWLGPLSAADARWSAASYAARRGAAWGETVLQRLVEVSWGYPALLRAVCEAYSAGAGLETLELRLHPAVQRRVAEFWMDRPSPEEVRLSGLDGQPLLEVAAPLAVDPASLTAAEQRLLDYLRAHPGKVCSKDELVTAVWPEEVAITGIRDESLAQLVHRLRDKIGPRFVQTLAGRGYRFNP